MTGPNEKPDALYERASKIVTDAREGRRSTSFPPPPESTVRNIAESSLFLQRAFREPPGYWIGPLVTRLITGTDEPGDYPHSRRKQYSAVVPVAQFIVEKNPVLESWPNESKRRLLNEALLMEKWMEENLATK